MVSELGSHPGDLGRRVRHRREELGLTRAELASRAGIKEIAVAYIEEEPVSARSEVVLRLAYALDLPDYALLGSDADVPLQFAGHRPSLDVLAEDECWRLLDDHGVGRIAFIVGQDEAPHVHPVNYAVHDHGLVVRARTGSLLAAAVPRYGPGCPVSFEVDHVDDAQRAGWSVLLRGAAVAADAADEPAAAEPWAGGVNVRQICVRPQTVTGRRIFVD